MVKRLAILFISLFSLMAVVVPPAHSAIVRDPGWETGGDSRACSAPEWREDLPLRAPALGRRILVIGDSLTRESRKPMTKKLLASGWNPTVRCFGGKRLDWALKQIKDQRKWRGLPDTIVLAVGTNDMRWISRSLTKQRMMEMMEAFGPRHNVIWVNTYGGNGDRFSKEKQAWFNRTLEKVAKRYPHVSVLPWAKMAKEGDVRLATPLHYNTKGFRYRSEVIVDYVNSTLR